MGNAATLRDKHLGSPPERSFSAGRLVLVLAILLVGLTIGGSVWIYMESTQALTTLTQTHRSAGAPNEPAAVPIVLKEVDTWVRQLSMAVAGGGAGAVVLLILTMMWGRHRNSRRLRQYRDENADVTKALEKATTDLTLQKSERRRLESELQTLDSQIDAKIQERTSELATAHATLQKELNDRRMAERVMAQQAKELERSKDVLELHVHARTQELEKLQRRYESILNSAGEGIYGLDLQGRTTFVNPATAKIMGWKVEELVGKLESEVFHRLPVDGNAPETQGEDGTSDHLIFYRQDGSSFPAEYVRTPIKEKGNEIGAVVIFKDITERKLAEEALNRKAAELARSNSELEQFAYVASHDLQEPLRKIQAFGDRLKTKCDAVNLEEGRDYLERMQSAAARMQTLINDLLTFSRVISASQPFVPVDLNILTKEVLGDLEVRIEQTKAQVEVEDLPTIEADPLQMRQLLQNLIGNALKFQQPDRPPVVKIQAKIIRTPYFGGSSEEESFSELCELSIEDNGIGFESKYVDKIFAVFQRLHGRNEYEGTGVGLAVCRRIMDRHGGTITATGEPGNGARFCMSIPVRRHRTEMAA